MRMLVSMPVLAASFAVALPAAAVAQDRVDNLSSLASRPLPTIQAGQVVEGSLDPTDVLRSDGSYADAFFYDGRAGETITVTERSPDFDSWLTVDEPSGPLRVWDDDSGGGRDSKLVVTLPRAGRYLIVANCVGKGKVGRYVLRVDSGK